MSARAIASGTIAFGLVSIPVKLHPAVSPSEAIRFNNLHAECGTRVKYQFWCPEHERVLTREDMVKGYEFAKDQYVTFSAEELAAVEEQSTRSIDIAEFVPIDQIDPVYYAKAYYLAPDKSAGRAYQLLAAALQKTGLVAIAKYAARGKQYLVLVRPVELGLVLQQLHYPHEVTAIEDVGIDRPEVKDGELELAMALVQQSASKTFRPEKYEDEVRERVKELIARKVEGQDITRAPAQSPKAQVIDLMAALKASLGMGSNEGRSEAGTTAPGEGTQRGSLDDDDSETVEPAQTAEKSR
jgi:DNA end-binding protein Ku